MKQTIRAFSQLLFLSGAFNIILALPLALPVLSIRYLEFLWSVNEFLGLGGQAIIPPQEGIYALFVNTAGIDLVLIGVLVVYAGLDPVRRKFIPLANAVGRTLFALVIVYYVIVMDIARLVLVIGSIDLLISIGFVYYLLQLQRIERNAV